MPEPLAPTLFRMLERRFGQVRVVNAGQPAVMGQRLSAQTGDWETYAAVPGEQYVVTCPFCGPEDHSGHLYISHLYGSSDPQTGRLLTHLVRCWRRECQSEPGRLAELENLIFSIRSVPLPTPQRAYGPERRGPLPTVQHPGQIELIDRLPASHAARRYLEDRGFDVEELAKVWRVGYVCEPAWSPAMLGRIYIPIVHDGRLVAWQGRWPAELDWSQAPIKRYYNMPGDAIGRVFYGLDEAGDAPLTVIVEGALDAWAVGPGAVALLGKSLTPARLTLLHSRRGKFPVIILLDSAEKDSDTARKAASIQAQLHGRFPGVSLASLPAALDPGDCVRHRGLLWDWIRQQVRV
jgi:hypothetical protein